MKNIPNEIYLQIGKELELFATSDKCFSDGEFTKIPITSSTERIFDNDLKYRIVKSDSNNKKYLKEKK